MQYGINRQKNFSISINPPGTQTALHHYYTCAHQGLHYETMMEKLPSAVLPGLLPSDRHITNSQRPQHYTCSLFTPTTLFSRTQRYYMNPVCTWVRFIINRG